MSGRLDGVMIDDQKHILQSYAGLLAGFLVGFWRGVLLLQQEMDKLPTLEPEPLTCILIGLQPLGHACFYACLGYWLCWLLYEFTADQEQCEMPG